MAVVRPSLHPPQQPDGRKPSERLRADVSPVSRCCTSGQEFLHVLLSRPQVDLSFLRFYFLAPCKRFRAIVCVLFALLCGNVKFVTDCLLIHAAHLPIKHFYQHDRHTEKLAKYLLTSHWLAIGFLRVWHFKSLLNCID